MALLEIDNLVARYGRITALEGISLTVEEGEIVTLIGANGAGKTTTLRAISASWKWPGHWQRSRGCSCSTNQPRG